MWRRHDVWKNMFKYWYCISLKKKKGNWLIGIAKERAGLPCHFMATCRYQVISPLKRTSGQKLDVCVSLLLSPPLIPVLNLCFLMRYYVQVVALLFSVNRMSFHCCYKVNYVIVICDKKEKQRYHESMWGGYMPVWEGVRTFPWAADLWAEIWRSQPGMRYRKCLMLKKGHVKKSWDAKEQTTFEELTGGQCGPNRARGRLGWGSDSKPI